MRLSARGGTCYFFFWACLLTIIIVQATLGATPGRGIPNSPLQAELGQEDRDEQELEPVLVEGQRPIREREILLDWLARLPGTFEVSGTVHLHRPGNERTVDANGRAVCVGLQAEWAPAIVCDLDVRWPPLGDGGTVLNGVAAFGPASMAFGYSFDRERSIDHLLVDGQGKAEGAPGNLMTPDTLVSRSRCLNVTGSCERVVRVTVPSNLEHVKLEVDIEVGQQKVMTQTLIMKRQR